MIITLFIFPYTLENAWQLKLEITVFFKFFELIFINLDEEVIYV